MNTLIPATAWLAQGGAAPAAGGSSPFDSSLLLLFAVVGLSFYFLILGPQRKTEKQRRERLEKLVKGDRIVTTGGIHGEVADAQPGKQTVVVLVDKGVRLTFSKAAVSQVNPDQTADAAPADAKVASGKPA